MKSDKIIFTEKYRAFNLLRIVITGYGLQRLMREFPGKGWKMSGLDKLLTKQREVKRKHGSGRPISVCKERGIRSA